MAPWTPVLLSNFCSYKYPIIKQSNPMYSVQHKKNVVCLCKLTSCFLHTQIQVWLMYLEGTEISVGVIFYYVIQILGSYLVWSESFGIFWICLQHKLSSIKGCYLMFYDCFPNVVRGVILCSRNGLRCIKNYIWLSIFVTMSKIY